MKRLFSKRFFIVLFSFLVFFILLFFLVWKLVFFYLKDITQERLTQLFQTPVSIRKVQIIEWKNWNKLKIQVNDLKLQGTPTDSVTQVAYANSVSAILPIIDIFFRKDSIHVLDLKIDSLFLDFYVDNERRKNYKLFKPYNPNRLQGPVWVQFHDAYIRACKFHYYFKLPDRDYLFELKDIYPLLTIRKKDLDLQLDAEGYIPYLREKQTSFMQNASLKVHYQATITKQKQDNRFKKCKLVVGGVPIELGGRFYLGWERDYDVRVQVLNANTDSLLMLFPRFIQEKVKVYDIDGALNVSGKIIGKWKPEFRVNFWADSVNITNTITQVGLHRLFLKGKFFNGGEKGKPFAELKVDTLSGSIYNNPFLAYFTIKDFNQFFLKGHFEMSQNLRVVGKWMGFEDTKNAKGSLNANIDIEGRIRDIAAFDMEKVHLKGYLDAKNIHLPPSWTPFEVQNTYFQLLFNNHEIILKNAKSSINQQPVAIEGWLSTKAFDLRPQFIANATITFDTLTPEKFIQKSIQKNATTFPNLPANFWIDLDIKANHILYKKIFLQEAYAKAYLKPHVLDIPRILIKGQQDSLLIRAFFKQIHPDTIKFQLHQEINTLSVLDILKELGFTLEIDLDIPLTNKTQITGQLYKKSPKVLDGNFDIKLWIEKLHYPKPDLTVNNFQASLNITLQNIIKPKESSWLVHHIQGQLNQQPFVGSIGLIPSDKGFWFYPSLEMELCLEAVQPFLKPENISDYGGNFEFSYFGKGLLKNFLNPDSAVYQSSNGEVWVHSLSFLVENKNLPFDSISGKIYYNDYGVWGRPICGKIANSDFCLEGNTQNILAYLFLKNTRLDGKIALQSDSLFIKELTAQNFIKTNEDKIKDFDIKLPQNVNLDIEAQIMNAIFEKLKFEYVLLNACLENRMAFIDDFDAYFDKGFWKTYLIWDGRDTNNQYVAANLFLKNLNVKNFLYDFNNFKQSFIEYQNIEGNLSLEGFLEMYFSNDLVTDFNTLKGYISFTLENGTLRNFIPFQKLKGIVRKKYLEAPNFTLTAQNIIIQNRMLYIPQLEIRSDIAHINISGTHSFEQDIDYRIQILRVKRRFKEDKAQAIRYDKTILLFRFQGSRGKYKLSYDFQAFWNKMLKKNKFHFNNK